MKTPIFYLIKFSFFTALLLMFSCENKSLGERQREADSIENAKNNPPKSAQDEINESFNQRMNSDVVKEINHCITMPNREDYTDESFKKYYKYKLKNIGNKTISSIKIGCLLIGTSGTLYHIDLKAGEEIALQLPRDEFQTDIVAVRFIDGTAIAFDSER